MKVVADAVQSAFENFTESTTTTYLECLADKDERLADKDTEKMELREALQKSTRALKANKKELAQALKTNSEERAETALRINVHAQNHQDFMKKNYDKGFAACEAKKIELWQYNMMQPLFHLACLATTCFMAFTLAVVNME
jgi:hypothetical protein